MAWIELKPEGAGPIRAWRADPTGKPRGGIVVIQEIFGVNSHIRAVTDRFAAEGYLAVAPAIFEHVEPKFETGYDADARRAAWRSPARWTASRCCATSPPRSRSPRKAARSRIVGFCLGGTVAWAAAGQLSGLSAAVGYYGGGIIGLKDLKPKVPTLLHFGEKDAHIPISGREGGRRGPSGRRGPHLSRRPRLQLRPAGKLRRAERQARLDADARVFAQAFGLSGRCF